MTTSLKTSTLAYKMLKEEVDTKLLIENKITNLKYKVNNKDKIKKEKENRDSSTFIFRKPSFGINSKLNLYPLIVNNYTNPQQKELKKTFKNLLLALYGQTINDLDAFIAVFIKDLKKTKSLAKIFSGDRKKREAFLHLCKDTKHSLLKYVTVQEHEEVQDICINTISKELLQAFAGKEALQKIYALEKKNYLAGKNRDKITEEEYKGLISPVQGSMIRTNSRSTNNHNQELELTKNGRIIISGAPPPEHI